MSEALNSNNVAAPQDITLLGEVHPLLQQLGSCDGLTDVAVYRPSTGDWFVRNQFSVNFGVTSARGAEAMSMMKAA